MKIRMEPLVTAVAIGAVIWIVGSLVGLIIGYRSFQNVITSPIFDPATLEEINTSADPMAALFGEDFQSMMVLSSVANLLQCLSWLFSGISAGAAYVVVHRRYEPHAMGGEAAAGAVAGALAVVAGYLVSTILSLVVIFPLVGDFMGQIVSVGGPEVAQMMDQMGSMMVVMVAVGAICSIVFYGAIGGVTGALGGFIGNSLTGAAREG
ncbi:MAG TPA: hypothetical protein PLD25_00870 [Chloroflexota bacterium]|nr:hypothetical protein [Chloroflexota bacterium]HUM72307.1 hypothetical protein [Chloroflexota bacterium]